MNIILSSSAQEPMYQQIYDQIAAQIIAGELKPDTPLPPIRTVAKELRISIITVKRAWEELERDGYITTAQGSGCYVRHAAESRQTRDRQIDEKIQKDVEYYKSMGLSKSEYLKLLDEIWNEP